MKRQTQQSIPKDSASWIPDDESADCMKCNNQFTCCIRRHHCRFCGFLLCSQCTPRRIQGLRACESCYQKDLQAGERVATLTSSPYLQHVQRLSPLIHTVSKTNKDRGFLTTESKVTTSPHITHSVRNLETLYGTPTSAVQETKGVNKSPLLSRGLSKQGVPLPAKSSVKPSSRSTAAEKKTVQLTSKDVMIIVDPFSTGAVLVAEFLSRGCKVIRVFSDDFPDHIINLVLEGIKLEYVGTVHHKNDVTDTIRQLTELKKSWNFLGCLPGCETGVELADAIAEAFKLRTNGTKLSDTRRNKFLMNEQVRKSGTKAVLQARASTLVEVNAFIKRFKSGPIKVVIKPVASAGSDRVYICRSGKELQDRFREIMDATNLLGKKNPEVVMQEFLEGTEFIVDTVSWNGVHKCLGIWEYDKRHANGHDFVYFGCKLKSGNNPTERSLIEYTKKVLDALEMKHGAGHAEVMFTPDGPRLVEIGARCQGAEGNWVPLANRCYGTSQVKALVDTYLDPEAWEATPDIPILTDWFANKVDLVSYVDGRLKALPKIDEVKGLKSFMKIEIMAKIGQRIRPTIDCITTPGSVLLCSQDERQVMEDTLRIRKMEETDFFLVESEESSPDKSKKKSARRESR